ncbi:MAG: imidazolonepropionase [Flavobacteriales bacterium]|nr:imidazolonepropionase [Flavobacteriales bacterium]
MAKLYIRNAKALVGTHPSSVRSVAGDRMADLPVLNDAWLLCEDGRITALGPMSSGPDIDPSAVQTIDAAGRYVLPGWCDPHTHTVFAASRDAEFVDRINGLSYQEIAARGGGILNSAAKLRVMDEGELFERSRQRVLGMIRQGTTALEIKSGYGLSEESELKMLRVIRRLKEDLPIRIKATLLAAHALPKEYASDRQAYLDLIIKRIIPRVVDEGLADHIDVFCETNYFTVHEMLRLLEAGSALGLAGKVHVNQFTSIGGIPAAVTAGALSVDHLEVMEEEDYTALSGGSTIPTLLPSCSFFLGIPYAPARRLIASGAPVALATDHNPGSAPSGNMNFVVSLACIKLRMLPEEAMNAATLNSAAAMALSDEVGSLTVGKRADLIITRPMPSLAYLPYAFGTVPIEQVIVHGQVIDLNDV